MAAITSAIIGTALTIKGQQDAKRAQQAAASKQSAAAAQSAQLLAQAGEAGAGDISAGAREAGKEIRAGMREAAREIKPYTQAAEGYDLASQAIMQGQPISGPLADYIRQASIQGANSRIFEGLGSPVQQEIARQAGINVSAISPDVIAAQLAQGTQGISALGDISNIRQRGFGTLSDLASGTAGSKATALIGQVPQLQQLSQSGQEARILSDVAGQRATTSGLEELAKLAGKVI